MIYGSVCSGIEAATQGWHQLGWTPAFFAEIEKFPSKVLAHHYPSVPNHGDFTTITGDEYGAVDVLVGGTPCQDFSVAGLRAGMDGKRGQLTVEFAHLAHRLVAAARTRWMVWENVPGVLSIDGGEAFATFLGICAKRTVRVPANGWGNSGIVASGDDGFGLAYRVLDAQHFGVPQRRRRVFVVGYFGDWRRAAAVLFERHGLSGDIAPRREKRQVAPTIPARSLGGGGLGTDFDCDGGVIEDRKPVGLDEEQNAVADGFGCLKSREKGGGFEGTVAVWPIEVAPTLNAHFGEKQGLEDQHIRSGQVSSSTGEKSHCLNAGGMGRQDFETETLLAVGGVFDQELYSITPSNSNKDYKARRADRSQAITTQSGAAPSARGGDIVLTHSLRGEGFDASEDGSGRGTPLVPVGIGTVAIGWSEELTASVELAGTVQRGGDGGRHEGVMTPTMAVRRLTPEECESLQGFPRGFTKIDEKTADGPRYKALGNSMAVPVMAYIGRRIEMVEEIVA